MPLLERNMPHKKDDALTFDKWFAEWFSNDLIDSLGVLRSDFDGIHQKLREFDLLWPALDESLDENAVAKVIHEERGRPPEELADMLGQLNVDLTNFQETVVAALTSRQKEVLRHELLAMLGRKV